MVLQAITGQKIMDNMALQATTMVVLEETIMDMVLQATIMDMVLQQATIMDMVLQATTMEMVMQIMDNMVMVSTEVIMIAVLRYRPLPEEFVEFVDSEPDNTKNNYKSI